MTAERPHGFLERQWRRVTPVSALLFPLSLLFRGVVATRRAAFRAGFLRSHRLPVPVVIVGNITVGGTGKTPLVLWLAQFLSARGRKPGIVTRGYGGEEREACEVTAASDPRRVGDEALLLARRGGVPVWIGRDRAAAGRRLLEAHPECDVLVSDDGLQHYALGRDVEIAVMDGEMRIGNGLMLPAGPLREPVRRLDEVDAVVVNGGSDEPGAFAMKLEGRELYNLADPERRVDVSHFASRRVHALAGIGNPQRFFDHLRRLGIDFEPHAFPDHHPYTAADLAFAGGAEVLMTEKDAVKCAAFANERYWALQVDAVPVPPLGELVLRKIGAT